MKLTPSEILAHLGLNIPADGIDINPDDAYLHVSALQLIGATMDINSVPDQTLQGLGFGLRGLIPPLKGEVVPHQPPDVDRLRAFLRVLLQQTYGLSAEPKS